MKKITLLLFTFSIIVASQTLAQTEKGTYLLGGSASSGFSGSGGEIDNFTFRVNPNIGVFIVDDLALGVSLPLQLNTSQDFTSVSYGITPNVRYYFVHVDKIGFFAGGSLGYSGYRSKSDNNTFTNNGITGSIGGGATYFLNKNIGLDGNLGYNFSDYENSEFNHSIGVSFGFQIFF